MAETQCHASSSRPESNGESSSSAAAAAQPSTSDSTFDQSPPSIEAETQAETQADAEAEVPEASPSTSAAAKPPSTCANCSLEESESKPLKPCIKCKSVKYCSRDCLKADFKLHKKVCAKASQEYAKTADFKPASRAPPKKDGFRGGLQKWQFDT